VSFVQLLDEREVRYGVGVNRMGSTLQWIEVSLTAEGAVGTVAYNAHIFQHVGMFSGPLCAAGLERFSASPTGAYGMYAVLSPEQPVTYRSWVAGISRRTGAYLRLRRQPAIAEDGAPLVQFSATR